MEISKTSEPKRHRTIVENKELSKNLGTDRLSNLPEFIILHILSFLPTEATILTGALARSWKSLWKEVRHLNFDDKHQKNRFSDHVISALLSYQNRFFESLTITVANDCDSTELAIWIAIALLKNVSKLVLRLNESGPRVTFPERAFQSTNTLKILQLVGNINLELPIGSVFLDCLEEMHLCHVTFASRFSFTRLLGGCPRLEYLVVDLFLGSGIDTLIINAPSLQRLTLASRYCVNEKFILQTPFLKYLDTKRLDGVYSFRIEAVSKIIEATITHHAERMDENLLSKMASARRLSLAAPLKLPMGIIFDDLTSLEIETKPGAWCMLLSHMLAYSPRLQVLNFVGGQYSRVETTWIIPGRTAGCLRSHLRTVVWKDYDWEGSDEIDVATYILKNAATLVDATFITMVPTEETDMLQKQAVLAHLANVERASPSANLSFRDTSILKRIVSNPQDPDVEMLVMFD